jgi:hypothetical protein
MDFYAAVLEIAASTVRDFCIGAYTMAIRFASQDAGAFKKMLLGLHLGQNPFPIQHKAAGSFHNTSRNDINLGM